MNSLFFAFSLAAVAAAQIQVNGVSTVPSASASVPETSVASLASGTAVASDFSAAVLPTDASAALVASGTPTVAGAIEQTGFAAPPQFTDAPVNSQEIYEQMPYTSFKSEGYKELSCGYGYSKHDDGYCRPEPWVSFCAYSFSPPS
jgi:hypothetical protein